MLSRNFCETSVRENFCNFHTTVWKNAKFSLTEKIFREINSLVTSLVILLISRNFCQKSMRENFRNFHTVHTAQCENFANFPPFQKFSVKSKFSFSCRLLFQNWIFWIVNHDSQISSKRMICRRYRVFHLISVKSKLL